MPRVLALLLIILLASYTVANRFELAAFPVKTAILRNSSTHLKVDCIDASGLWVCITPKFSHKKWVHLRVKANLDKNILIKAVFVSAHEEERQLNLKICPKSCGGN